MHPTLSKYRRHYRHHTSVVLNSSGQCKYLSFIYFIIGGPRVIQFLPSMKAIVDLKGFTMRKANTTCVTYVRFIPSMSTNMHIKRRLMCKLGTTRVTFISFLPSMCRFSNSFRSNWALQVPHICLLYSMSALFQSLQQKV